MVYTIMIINKWLQICCLPNVEMEWQHIGKEYIAIIFLCEVVIRVNSRDLILNFALENMNFSVILQFCMNELCHFG